MDHVINKAGLRLKPGMQLKDCKPTDVRHGRIVEIESSWVEVNWGPGKNSTKISIETIHQNHKRKTGFYLFRPRTENQQESPCDAPPHSTQPST